jgi:hypothetical protein
MPPVGLMLFIAVNLYLFIFIFFNIIIYLFDEYPFGHISHRTGCTENHVIMVAASLKEIRPSILFMSYNCRFWSKIGKFVKQFTWH